MGNPRKTKSEHGGAKNGGGYWGTREEAKDISNKIRRKNDKDSITEFEKEELEKDKKSD